MQAMRRRQKKALSFGKRAFFKPIFLTAGPRPSRVPEQAAELNPWGATGPEAELPRPGPAEA